MKQLVYKIREYFKIRINLIWIGIRYDFKLDTAFLFNNWASSISVTIYVVAEIIFLEVVYSNVNTIASYTKDEMLVFLLLGQIWANYFFTIPLVNSVNLVSSINSGQLDLILTKPLPSLFFLSFRRIALYKTVRDGLPSIIAICIMINWSNIYTYPSKVIAGLIILISGIIISSVITFLSCLPAFWLGESTSLMQLALDVQADAGNKFPFEGYSKPFRLFFLFILPVAFSSGISSAVIFGKLAIFPFLPIAIIMAFFYMILQKVLWEFSLKHYTSASS